MYIDLKIIYFTLAILGCISLIYLTITLVNLNKFINNINKLVLDNKNNISKSFAKLPSVVSNFNDASESIKDITEVATDVTADLLVTKESIQSNVKVVTDIFNILKNVFGK